MSKTEALKPCPFCGSTDMHRTSNGNENHSVFCNICGAEGPAADSDTKAADAWNERAALAQPAASGEPVAWHMRVIGCDGSVDWCELGAKPPEPVQGVEALPMMYAQPAAPDAQKGAA